MNFVEPIRDRKKISQIKNLLLGQRRYRDLLLFVVGINTALRISDLLELQISHFLDNNLRIKRRFWIKEQKRGKRHEVVINNSIRQALSEFLKAYPGVDNNPECYMFSTLEPTTMLAPSNVVKPGSSSRPSARKLGCRGILELTVCVRLGFPCPYEWNGSGAHHA
jgi:integrase